MDDLDPTTAPFDVIDNAIVEIIDTILEVAQKKNRRLTPGQEGELYHNIGAIKAAIETIENISNARLHNTFAAHQN